MSSSLSAWAALASRLRLMNRADRVVGKTRNLMEVFPCCCEMGRGWVLSLAAGKLAWCRQKVVLLPAPNESEYRKPLVDLGTTISGFCYTENGWRLLTSVRS